MNTEQIIPTLQWLAIPEEPVGVLNTLIYRKFPHRLYTCNFQEVPDFPEEYLDSVFEVSVVHDLGTAAVSQE